MNLYKFIIEIATSAFWFLTGFIWPSLTTYGPQYKPKQIEELKHKKKTVSLKTFPLISIVIPSFNQGRYLERCINSLISQDYPRLEIIVVDGGSTDETNDILNKYSTHFSWWCSEPDKGQAHALNKGFLQSMGEIMAWLNSDDQLLPNTLHRVAKYFESHTDVDVVYGQRILINEDDQEIGRWILPPHNNEMLNWMDIIPQETVFWKRSIWEKTGCSINETFQFAMDWDILLRFRNAGANIVRLPYFMGLFRIHPDQKTFREIDSVGLREMERLKKRCLGYIPSKFKNTIYSIKLLLKVRFVELMWKFGMVSYG